MFLLNRSRPAGPFIGNPINAGIFYLSIFVRVLQTWANTVWKTVMVRFCMLDTILKIIIKLNQLTCLLHPAIPPQIYVLWLDLILVTILASTLILWLNRSICTRFNLFFNVFRELFRLVHFVTLVWGCLGHIWTILPFNLGVIHFFFGI